MGYRADGSLAELFPDLVDEVASEGVKRVGELLHENVVRRTPVARMPLAYDADRRAGGKAGWIKDRKGRLPGTARKSWETSSVEHLPDGTYRVVEESKDPVMPMLEYDTRPHLIRARKAGALRFPWGLRFIFRQQVQHPGTQGVHMMRDSLAEVEGAWRPIVQAVLDEAALKEQRAPRPLFPLRG